MSPKREISSIIVFFSSFSLGLLFFGLFVDFFSPLFFFFLFAYFFLTHFSLLNVLSGDEDPLWELDASCKRDKA